MDWACLLEKRGISLGAAFQLGCSSWAAFLLFQLFLLFRLFQLFQLFQLILSGFEFSTCPSSLLLYII